MDPSSAFSAKSRAAHGRACTNCAQAKAKCITDSGLDNKCRRCSRLNKDCLSLPPRAGRRRPPHATHVSKLEDKLDNLVKLLGSTQQPLPSKWHETMPLGSTPELSLSFDTCTTPNSLMPPSSGAPSLNLAADHDAPSSASDPVPSECQNPKTRNPIGCELDLGEANILLNTFRNEFSPNVPFVVVPPSLTAQDLQRDRPFLYAAIMAVTCQGASRRSARGRELMKTLGERMLIKGEKSLDLLLGILTYVGWYHFLFHDSPNMTSSLALAMSLVSDLGLNASPYNEPDRLFEDAVGVAHTRVSSVNSRSRTLEEHRAVLGCFYMSSVTPAFFGKTDTLRWTSYMDECLRVVGETGEYQSDVYAVALVKLQLIAERIGQSPWHEESGSTGSFVPAGLFVKAVQAQLVDFKRNLSRDLEQNAHLLMHYYNVELSLYKVGLSKKAFQATSNNQDFQRLEILYACLQAVRSFFDVYFSIPVGFYRGSCLVIFLQLGHSVIMLQKLSSFGHPDWDVRHVQETVSLSSILDRLIERFETLERIRRGLDREVDGNNEQFSRIAKKLYQIKTWHEETRIAGDFPGPAMSTEQDAEIAMAGIPLDFLDGAWLTDILIPGDFQFDPPVQ